MQFNKSEFVEAAKKNGADLVGVAPVERFRGIIPEGHPNSISPKARSVVVLGFMIPRGALRGIEEGTAWQTLGCGDPVNPLIQVESTYNTVRWLEDRGWEATPLYKHPLELRNQGVPVVPGKPAPDVILNFEYAAFAAGLGVIGKGKFFLSPEYGPRQVFSIILTDAPIEPDKLYEGDFCEDCDACVTSCPALALSATEQTVMPGYGIADLKWNKLRTESCVVCKTGATENPYLKSAEPWRVGASCGRACVASLDRRNLLLYKYANAFRKEDGK
jgi:epoxyqueuosine reductase QueG